MQWFFSRCCTERFVQFIQKPLNTKQSHWLVIDSWLPGLMRRGQTRSLSIFCFICYRTKDSQKIIDGQDRIVCIRESQGNHKFVIRWRWVCKWRFAANWKERQLSSCWKKGKDQKSFQTMQRTFNANFFFKYAARFYWKINQQYILSIPLYFCLTVGMVCRVLSFNFSPGWIENLMRKGSTD